MLEDVLVVLARSNSRSLEPGKRLLGELVGLERR